MLLENQARNPLYRQLSRHMRERILSGEWRVDEKIPTEPELCAEYKVSRMTVRLALDELRSEGLIYRQQGKGTFVKQPQMNQSLSYFYSFNNSAAEDSTAIRKEILSWKLLPAGEELAGKLQILPDDQVYTIERLLFFGDKPFSVEISCVPVKLCPGLTPQKVEEEGLYHSLDACGVRPNGGIESFEAVILETRCQKVMQTGPNTPGFFVERLSKHDELPVEFCRSYVNGRQVKYHVSLR